MSLKLNVLKCPNCGANLQVEEGRKKLFCSYCGAPIEITNENEYVIHHIDEAKIRQNEEENSQTKSSNTLKTILTVVWAIVSIALISASVAAMFSEGTEDLSGFLIGLMMFFYVCVPVMLLGGALIFSIILKMEKEKIQRSKNQEILQKGGILFPLGLEPFDRKDYKSLQQVLIAAGFTNILCISLHDTNPAKKKKKELLENNGE